MNHNAKEMLYIFKTVGFIAVQVWLKASILYKPVMNKSLCLTKNSYDKKRVQQSTGPHQMCLKKIDENCDNFRKLYQPFNFMLQFCF